MKSEYKEFIADIMCFVIIIGLGGATVIGVMVEMFKDLFQGKP